MTAQSTSMSASARLPSLIAAEEFPLETIVVAYAPEISYGGQAIRKPSELLGQALIRSEQTLYSWHQWAKDHNLEIDLTRGPRFSDAFVSIVAAVEGRGVCLESFRLREREVEKGNLVLPFGMTVSNMGCHRLTYVQSQLRALKISAFKSWLETVWSDAKDVDEIEMEGAVSNEARRRTA